MHVTPPKCVYTTCPASDVVHYGKFKCACHYNPASPSPPTLCDPGGRCDIDGTCKYETCSSSLFVKNGYPCNCSNTICESGKTCDPNQECPQGRVCGDKSYKCLDEPLCPDNGEEPIVATEQCNCGGWRQDKVGNLGDGTSKTWTGANDGVKGYYPYCKRGMYCTHQGFWTIPTNATRIGRMDPESSGWNKESRYNSRWCDPLNDGCFYCTESPMPKGIWSGHIGVCFLFAFLSTLISFSLIMFCFTACSCCFPKGFFDSNDDYKDRCCEWQQFNRRIPGCVGCFSDGSEKDDRKQPCIPQDLHKFVYVVCCLPSCLFCGSCCCILPAVSRCCWEEFCCSDDEGLCYRVQQKKLARRKRRHERRKAKKLPNTLENPRPVVVSSSGNNTITSNLSKIDDNKKNKNSKNTTNRKMMNMDVELAQQRVDQHEQQRQWQSQQSKRKKNMINRTDTGSDMYTDTNTGKQYKHNSVTGTTSWITKT